MIVALIYGIISLSFQTSTITIADFKNQQDISNWFVVNDGVMGGYSNGSISLSDDGYGLYQGYVTTRNNGGFSSIRYRFKPKQISKYTHVSLRVRGDGKIYQFRIKNQYSEKIKHLQSNYIIYNSTQEKVKSQIIRIHNILTKKPSVFD